MAATNDRAPQIPFALVSEQSQEVCHYSTEPRALFLRTAPYFDRVRAGKISAKNFSFKEHSGSLWQWDAEVFAELEDSESC